MKLPVKNNSFFCELLEKYCRINNSYEFTENYYLYLNVK